MVGEVGEGAFDSFWWGHGLDGKNNFHHGFDLIKTTVSIFNWNHKIPQRETFSGNWSHGFDFGFDYKIFGIKTMVSITSKTEIETKTRTWKTPWTRSLTCLCLSTLGLGLFWSEQAHDASLCTLVDLIIAMASPTCFKITGRGRSSHLEGHSPERNPEKRWLGGHLPKMPTPSENINLTTHHPDKEIHTDTTVDAYPANFWCVCHLIAVVVLAPLIQTMVSICGKMGVILTWGHSPGLSLKDSQDGPTTLRIFWGYFLPQKLFLFSEVIFKDPPKIPFKTSIKITSRGYFYFWGYFCLAKLFLTNSLKRFLGERAPTKAPVRVDLALHESSHETSHEGVHGSGQGSPLLCACSL